MKYLPFCFFTLCAFTFNLSCMEESEPNKQNQKPANSHITQKRDAATEQPRHLTLDEVTLLLVKNLTPNNELYISLLKKIDPIRYGNIDPAEFKDQSVKKDTGTCTQQ